METKLTNSGPFKESTREHRIYTFNTHRHLGIRLQALYL
jgi:hypothetical protein